MTLQVLWGECISGALYNEDFKGMARQAGFADPRVLSASNIDVTDPELAQVVGNAVFHSITYRLFKVPDLLESLCEDYGQFAVYKVQLCDVLQLADFLTDLQPTLCCMVCNNNLTTCNCPSQLSLHCLCADGSDTTW